MVTGSRTDCPERSNSLWDSALRVALRALPESLRVLSDVEIGSENAWLEEICRGRFESRDSDEVTGNAEAVECEIPTAGETDVTTGGTEGLLDAFSLPLAVVIDPSKDALDVVISSRLDPDSMPSAKGSNPGVFPPSVT